MGQKDGTFVYTENCPHMESKVHISKYHNIKKLKCSDPKYILNTIAVTIQVQKSFEISNDKA